MKGGGGGRAVQVYPQSSNKTSKELKGNGDGEIEGGRLPVPIRLQKN
ncbi:hypothetical protein ADU37_CDS22230 [Thermococcus sp. 2319x1]|nr:hypothetical protein ADU37_CDS22230 [Thermococcus sp. 2319x1]